MKKSAIIIITALGLLLGAGSLRSDDFTECQSRCGRLTGQGLYRCIQTCVSTKKKSRKPGSNRVKEKIGECEEICKKYTGLENVKCLRICLEKNK